ncbi:MAG: hypothetical protein PHQ57_04785 [Candidatus Omnitrophica bacterium]|nr:hypothetical protein [Candidatus Omnitrophota bacterium]
MKRLYFIIILITLGFVNLAKANTISLEPAHVRLSVSAGQAKNGTIHVDNPSNKEIKVRAYLEDWRYSSCKDGTKEFFPEGTLASSCSRWVSFSPAEFSLPPFGRQVVNYTIHVPQDSKGGYFSVMFFETDLAEVKNTPDSEVQLKARLGALFSIEIKDSIVCKADLESLKIEKENDTLKLLAQFNNKGNVDIAPKILFHLIDTEGQVLCRGKFDEIFTLPQDNAEVTAATKIKLLPTGKYLLVITLNLGRGLPLVKEIPLCIDQRGNILIERG